MDTSSGLKCSTDRDGAVIVPCKITNGAVYVIR